MTTKPQDIHVKRIMDLARQVIPYFERTFFNRYIQDYKDYLGYKADRQREIEDWQTNVVFTSTAGLVDTMYASIYDSKFKFGVKGEGILGVDKVLNNIFDFEGKAKQALMDSVKECIITGKGFIKPYFMAYKDKKVIRGKNYGSTIKRIMIDYVSIFNVFYDYNGPIHESPFIIERYILNRKQILHRYGSKIGENASDIIKAIVEKPVVEQFSQYDINRVKHIISYESIIRDKKNKINTSIPTTLTSTGELNDDINNRNNVFGVDFEKNKVYEVIEHSDDDEITVIVDGKQLVKVNKTLGIDIPMVQSISFNQIPGTTDSLGIGSMNRDTQQISNTLFNIYLDNLKMSIAPMFESVGGMNSFLGSSNKLVYSPYRVVPTNTPGSLRKLDLNIAGFEPINTIQFMTTAARENIGISEQIMGAQGKIERISGGPEMLMNQFKSRLLPMTNSVMTAMGRIAKILLIMAATYFKESELKEMGLEEKLDIKRFLDEKNITFNMAALSILDNEEKLNYLSENLAVINNLGRGEDGKPTVNIQEVIKAILTKQVDVEAILKPRMPDPQNFEAKPGTVGAPGFPPMDALAPQGGTENPLQKPDQTPEDLANALSNI